MHELRLLHPGDEAALDAFLAQHADTSMFLRSNARAAGLFADPRNAAAKRAYLALGFEIVGDYGLVLLAR